MTSEVRKANVRGEWQQNHSKLQKSSEMEGQLMVQIVASFAHQADVHQDVFICNKRCAKLCAPCPKCVFSASGYGSKA